LSVFTKIIENRAKELGLSLRSTHAPHFLGIRLTEPPPKNIQEPETWTARAVSFLRKRNIYVADRFGSIRVSPHLYNTRDHIEKFCQALTEFCDKNGPFKIAKF